MGSVWCRVLVLLFLLRLLGQLRLLLLLLLERRSVGSVLRRTMARRRFMRRSPVVCHVCTPSESRMARLNLAQR